MNEKKYRKIKLKQKSRPTMEGAGVRLRRAFGSTHDAQFFDPFLLLDDFSSDNPDDYLKGFPSHPHRGIETITYMLQGEVNHEDSLGNKGTICTDEVQWMTAGSGIIHSEMPNRQNGLMAGFQLWANLPADQKMMEPKYRDITSDQICVVEREDGSRIRVIAGIVDGFTGPVQDVVIEPQYLDVFLPPNTTFTHKIPAAHTVFAYIIDGKAEFDKIHNEQIDKHHVILYEKDGVDEVSISTKEDSVRFLLISGMPLNEPIAWYGPIVMNTQKELETAFREYQQGSFLKHNK